MRFLTTLVALALTSCTTQMPPRTAPQNISNTTKSTQSPHPIVEIRDILRCYKERVDISLAVDSPGFKTVQVGVEPRTEKVRLIFYEKPSPIYNGKTVKAIITDRPPHSSIDVYELGIGFTQPILQYDRKHDPYEPPQRMKDMYYSAATHFLKKLKTASFVCK